LCALGYSVTSTFTCAKITELFCLDEYKNKCTLCSGKIPENGTCLNNCDVKNCLACNKEGTCAYCNSGYYREQYGGCIKSTNGYKNCLQKKLDEEECNLCDHGYHLENGKCIRIASITEASSFLRGATTDTADTSATTSKGNHTTTPAETSATTSKGNHTTTTDSKPIYPIIDLRETNTIIDPRVSKTSALALALGAGIAALITALL